MSDLTNGKSLPLPACILRFEVGVDDQVKLDFKDFAQLIEEHQAALTLVREAHSYLQRNPPMGGNAEWMQRAVEVMK